MMMTEEVNNKVQGVEGLSFSDDSIINPKIATSRVCCYWLLVWTITTISQLKVM